jgi:hypothetical protein
VPPSAHGFGGVGAFRIAADVRSTGLGNHFCKSLDDELSLRIAHFQLPLVALGSNRKVHIDQGEDGGEHSDNCAKR